MKISFTKMHGAGNDYIYVDATRFNLHNPSLCAQMWSRPHFGIGSDGLVLIGPSAIADFSMRIFNADGSEARMCGNASRCIAKYVYEKGLTDKQEIRLETLSGIKTLRLTIHDSVVQAVTVDMGEPVATRPLTLPEQLAQAGKEAWFINMGNPHVVVFVDDIQKIDLHVTGPHTGAGGPCPTGGSMWNSFRCWKTVVCVCAYGSAAPASHWPAAPALAPHLWPPRHPGAVKLPPMWSWTEERCALPRIRKQNTY